MSWKEERLQALDIAVQWWISDKLKNWFTQYDIDTIKSISWYSSVDNSMFDLADDGKYYINEKWLNSLWIEVKDMPTSWAAREINKIEEWNISNRFKEVMKNLKQSNRQISDETIDIVASSQTYQDVREKVADVVC